LANCRPADAVLDGEVVAHCEAGLPDFHRTLSSAGQRTACLLAFDLLAVDGEDLRPLPPVPGDLIGF
jgi:ATP-dependent DNA ligase